MGLNFYNEIDFIEQRGRAKPSMPPLMGLSAHRRIRQIAVEQRTHNPEDQIANSPHLVCKSLKTNT
ncbi:MAG: hypothetical protein DMG85_07815 [Acidobacteria bacterium]|nr:MAG: hypothetical protein DMG85_07815 [Acidobacteriota bacterium]